MAIVRFGGNVIGIRGTIGGVVFSQTHSGPYAKVWKRPRNQSTPIAAASKRQITTYGTLWSNMTIGEQAAWSAFAAAPPELDFNSLGIQYWLTGYQWLVRANVRRELLGLAATTTVPTATPVTAPATCTLTAVNAGTLNCDVSWTADDIPAGHGAMCYIAVYPTTGLAAFPGKGLLTWSEFEPAGTSKDISVDVIDRFGNIPPNWSIFAKLHSCRADGIRSIATPGAARVT